MKLTDQRGGYTLTVHTTKVDEGFEGIAIISTLDEDLMTLKVVSKFGPYSTRQLARKIATEQATLPFTLPARP